jgi:hypothetical protein
MQSHDNVSTGIKRYIYFNHSGGGGLVSDEKEKGGVKIQEPLG